MDRLVMGGGARLEGGSADDDSGTPTLDCSVLMMIMICLY
jgi:hypothetical protein